MPGGRWTSTDRALSSEGSLTVVNSFGNDLQQLSPSSAIRHGFNKAEICAFISFRSASKKKIQE